ARVRRQYTPRRVSRLTLVTIDPVEGRRGAVVGLRDVTELRRVEADARRQHVILSKLVGSATDLIAMLDTDGSFVWANDAFGEAVGRSAADVAGLTLSDVLPPSEWG